MEALPDNLLLGALAGVPGMERPAGPAGLGPQAEPGREPLYYRPRRRAPRYPGREDAQHPWETATTELSRYLEEMPAKLAEAVAPKGRVPFATDAPRAAQVDYWLDQFIGPDGTPNLPAIQQFIATADPDQITALAAALRAKQQQGGARP